MLLRKVNVFAPNRVPDEATCKRTFVHSVFIDLVTE